MKSSLKEKSINLRKEGLSYNEILKVVPVAKSTLSLWLRSVELAKPQLHILSEKKRAAVMKGGKAKRDIRLQGSKGIHAQAVEDIKKMGFTKDSLFLLGIALYWAEGAKQKEHNVSQSVIFSNSDPQMLLIFLVWLDTICNIKKDGVKLDLYIHESANIENALVYWSTLLQYDKKRIRVRLKKNIVKSFRKNRDVGYYGLIRIVVLKSTNLNRRIAGWIQGICTFCPVV